jgi:hypothetical protein
MVENIKRAKTRKKLRMSKLRISKLRTSKLRTSKPDIKNKKQYDKNIK